MALLYLSHFASFDVEDQSPNSYTIRNSVLNLSS